MLADPLAALAQDGPVGAQKAGSAQTDTAQTDTAQTDTAQTDAAQTDAAQTDAAQLSPEEQKQTEKLIARYSAQVGQPKTLTQLFELADAHAPELLEARERLGLGDAAVEGAQRLQPYNPQVQAEAGLGLDDVGLARVEVTLKQRLEVAGERGLRIDAARRQKKTLRAQSLQAQWSVHQQVHRLHRLGLVNKRRIAVEREILEFTQELFRIAQLRFDAGEEPKTSVIVARAEMATSRQRLVEVWTSYIQTLRRLGAAVGWDDDQPPQPAGKLGAIKPPPAKQALLDKALANDPTLAVLDAKLDEQRAQLALRRREVWPNPLVGVGYERENLGTNAVADKVRFILGIPLPLWDRNQGEIAAAEARINVVSQAIKNRRGVLQNLVFAQVDTLQATYRQAQIFEQEVLPALETQLGLLQEGFELGELSLLDVMNARDRLLSVQRQYLAAQREYFVAVSDLEELLGTSIWTNR